MASGSQQESKGAYCSSAHSTSINYLNLLQDTEYDQYVLELEMLRR